MKTVTYNVASYNAKLSVESCVCVCGYKFACVSEGQYESIHVCMQWISLIIKVFVTDVRY